MNKVIELHQRPIGKPTLKDFKIVTLAMPSIAVDGDILLKTLYVSVDPYLRGRMNDAKSYIPSFELGKPIESVIIAEVMASRDPEFITGNYVTGNLQWKEFQVSDGKGLQKIDKDHARLSSHLGILGMTGLTAYIGLTEIGQPKRGETLVVSGAAGAVGTVVGQIGKLLGCKVIGITGSDEKVNLITSRFKFDHAINYKTTSDLAGDIKKACPNGVDVYFDNVGGTVTDAVLENINKYARIALCGAISFYNSTETESGPRVEPILISKSAMMKGFIISDHYKKFHAATKQLADWIDKHKITYSETIVEGFDNIPQAFIDLFEGKNEGKMIVKV